MLRTRPPRRSAAAMALALVVGGVTAVAVATATPAAAAINPADFQQVTLAKGVAEIGEPMSISRAAGPLGAAHRPQRHAAPHRRRTAPPRVVGNIPVYTHDEEGLQGVAADPNFATQPLHLPVLRAAADHPGRRRARHRHRRRLGHLDRGQPAVPVHPQRRLHGQHGQPGQRPGRARQPGHVLPRRRRHRLRRGRQPVPVHRRRHQPVRLRPATRRSTSGPTATRPTTRSAPRATPTTCAARSCGSRSTPTARTRSRRATCSRRARRSTRPEIYAMGFRNPFRMSVDKATGVVYVGDYGPDAGTTNANRGPSGQVEFDRITAPGNYGWPYCTGTNTTTETYNEWNFATEQPPAPKFNCAGGPTNNSFRNTGLAHAAPAPGRPGSATPATPAPRRSSAAAPSRRWAARSTATTRANPSTDEVPAVAGRAVLRRRVRPRLDQADRRSTPTAPAARSTPSRGPASRSWTWRSARTARCTCWTTAPASATATRTRRCTASSTSAAATTAPRSPSPAPTRPPAPAPLTVNFSSAGSTDPEGGALTYSWAFGDGTTSTAANPTQDLHRQRHLHRHADGARPAGRHRHAPACRSPSATPRRRSPSTAPATGSWFASATRVPFSVTVTDPEDGTIDCTEGQA